MKKIILLLVTILFFISGTVSEAMYANNDWVGNYGVHCYNAIALNDFNEYGEKYVIGIEKVNFKSNDNSMYMYAISFAQPIPIGKKPITPQKIMLASEQDYLSIEFSQPKIDAGTNSIIIKQFYIDTDRMNSLILNSNENILIRVITTDGFRYDFYATDSYLNELKQVARWL